jgi:hypothetical protein
MTTTKNLLFAASIHVLNQDAGTLYVGASSIEEAHDIIDARCGNFDNDTFNQVSFIGVLYHLQTPYSKDPYERTFDVLGDTNGLFASEGEDWLSIMFDKTNKEKLPYQSLILCREMSHSTFIDREMPFLYIN